MSGLAGAAAWARGMRCSRRLLGPSAAAGQARQQPPRRRLVLLVTAAPMPRAAVRGLGPLLLLRPGADGGPALRGLCARGLAVQGGARGPDRADVAGAAGGPVLPPGDSASGDSTGPTPPTSSDAGPEPPAAAAAAGEAGGAREEGAAEAVEAAAMTTSAAATGGVPGAAATESEDKLDPRVWPVAFSILLTGCGVGVVMPLLPLFSRELGVTPAQFGLVVSIMGATRLLFNIPAAWACDRFGRRPMLIGGSCSTALGMVGTAMATSFSDLLTMRFATGAGSSAYITGAQMYMVDISHPRNRARTLAPGVAAFTAGMAVGPALGGIVAASYGFVVPLCGVGVAMGVAAGMNYALLTETRAPRPGPQKSLLSEFRDTAKQWRPLLQSGDMRMLLMLNMCNTMTGSGAQLALLPLLATDRLGMSLTSLGMSFALMAAINVLSSQPAAWVADRYGRKSAIVPAVLIISSAMAALPFCSSTEQFVAMLAVWGFGSSFLGTAPTAMAVDVSPANSRTQALALTRCSADIGLMLGASMLGFAAQHYSLDVAMLSASGILFAAGTTFALRVTETKPSS